MISGGLLKAGWRRYSCTLNDRVPPLALVAGSSCALPKKGNTLIDIFSFIPFALLKSRAYRYALRPT